MLAHATQVIRADNDSVQNVGHYGRLYCHHAATTDMNEVMEDDSKKFEIVGSTTLATITGALRTVAQVHPILAPLGQAWSEYESYRTARRIEELISNLAKELQELRQQVGSAGESLQPTQDFPELLERTVEKVRKEFDAAIRAKYARLLATFIVKGDASKYSQHVQLIESLDTLSELDLRVLLLFKGKQEQSIGEMNLDSLALEGDVNSQIWQVATSLAKLESRGLLVTASTHSGVINVQEGLNKDTARWRETKYRLLLIGQLLIETILD
jgi:hypothetical protein